MKSLSACAAAGALFAFSLPALAAPAQGEPLLGSPLGLVLLLGVIAVLPFAFMTLTAFVKISTVLQIVRGAIGAQNVPSNIIVMALAGALTLLAMAPLGSRVMARAEPVLADAEQRPTAAWVVQLWEAARETGSWVLESERQRPRTRALLRCCAFGAARGRS